MRHSGALRNFASTIRALAARGHHIHLVFMLADKRGDGRLLRELTGEWRSSITVGEIAGKKPWHFWRAMARAVRTAADAARYLTPAYADAHALRDRAVARVPLVLRALLRAPIVRTRVGLAMAHRFLRLIERAIPIDRSTLDVVAAANPDVVLVTPLVDLGSEQVEYIRAARALGIRSGLAVHSWDNLTNKGIIRTMPDAVFVWNEAQKREAVTMHGLAPEAVVVTGAPVYDQWFARVPSTTRDEFCAHIGLRADRPFFLYLCSSPFIAADEAQFVQTWIAAVRAAADARVREAGLLVRPHPDNLQPWQSFDTAQFTDVVVWPRGGADPVDQASKDGYYDSMYHAAAAVGINTSAQIEVGIVGRPVYSIRTPEYAATQEGTLHFHYLLNEGGGLLRMDDSLDEHTRALAAALDRTDDPAARVRGFVQTFVRPHGLDVDATPLLADAVEDLGRLPKREPERMSAAVHAIRLMLYPVGAAMNGVRHVTRSSRKSTSAPLVPRHLFPKRFAAVAARCLRWRAVNRLANRDIVQRRSR